MQLISVIRVGRRGRCGGGGRRQGGGEEGSTFGDFEATYLTLSVVQFRGREGEGRAGQGVVR